MPNYRPMLSTLRDDLERFIAERDALQQKIERIVTAIKAIELLAQENDTPIIEPPPLPPDEEGGFTERVRAILLANAPRRLTAIEIRDVLMKATPKDDPKTVLIHTHNTLKRLHKQDEVEETQIADGRNAYQWIDGLTVGDLTGTRGTSLDAVPLPPEHPLGRKKRLTLGDRIAGRE